MAIDPVKDEAFRAAMFAFLDAKTDEVGEVIWNDLINFEFEGHRVPLIGMRGIQRPSGLKGATTILTTYVKNPSHAPYDDGVGLLDDYVRYKWRGADGASWDNRALRSAMELQLPLVWFRGVAPGKYVPIYPVWVVGEESEQQQFILALDAGLREQWEASPWAAPDLAGRRLYAQVITKQRLHQPMFRARVLEAYRHQCAICRLKHVELLEAAHIREDSKGGAPVVPNGVALCAIHHRAFDKYVIAIRPDYVVQVRGDVLTETDGPTLKHALQGVHESRIELPRQVAARPDVKLLEERFAEFLKAG